MVDDHIKHGVIHCAVFFHGNFHEYLAMCIVEGCVETKMVFVSRGSNVHCAALDKHSYWLARDTAFEAVLELVRRGYCHN